MIDPEDFAAAAAAHHAALSGEEGGSSDGGGGGDVFGDVITPISGSTAPTSPEMVASPDLASTKGGEGGVPGTPTSEKDVSPLGSPIVENAGQAQFRRHHRRQSSLGTTRTSPSTRRRSLENTISMIREAMSKNDESMGEPLSLSLSLSLSLLRLIELTGSHRCRYKEELAEKVAGNESPRSPSSPRNSISAGSSGPRSPPASPTPARSIA